MPRTPQYYKQLFDTMVINQSLLNEAKNIANTIKLNYPKYDQISVTTGVPKSVIGIIHNMECSLNFSKHLHNGDSLQKRTIQIPKNRPIESTPPFTFQFSAIDALKYDGFDKVKDWSIENTLNVLEKYNGLGYSKLNVNSPYIWAGCNHYVKGKYVADNVYDPKAISKQIGCALILKLLQ